MAKRPKRKKGPKRVTYRLIEANSEVGKPMYRLLRELVGMHHAEIKEARIALAWNTGWKPDVDGRVVLGKCKKASDLDRELAAYDFIIILRQSFWQDLQVTDEQRRALLDHELCHAAPRCDERTGDPIVDERGRIAYRIRKHDIEEFTDIVHRHGLYMRDLELFGAQILERLKREGFRACGLGDCKDGWTPVLIDGVARLQRCSCFTRYQQARRETEAA